MKKVFWGIVILCCIVSILVMIIVKSKKCGDCESIAYDLIHIPLPCYNVINTALDNDKNDSFIFNTRDEIINFDKEYGTTVSRNIKDDFIGKNLILIKVDWKDKANGLAYKIQSICYKDNIITIQMKPKQEKITIRSNEKVVYDYFLLIEMDENNINKKTVLDIAVK